MLGRCRLQIHASDRRSHNDIVRSLSRAGGVWEASPFADETHAGLQLMPQFRQQRQSRWLLTGRPSV